MIGLYMRNSRSQGEPVFLEVLATGVLLGYDVKDNRLYFHAVPEDFLVTRANLYHPCCTLERMVFASLCSDDASGSPAVSRIARPGRLP